MDQMVHPAMKVENVNARPSSKVTNVIVVDMDTMEKIVRLAHLASLDIQSAKVNIMCDCANLSINITDCFMPCI